jgi:predicted phosphodiesterase
LLESPGRQWIGRDPSAVTEFNGLRIGGLDYQRGRERFLEAWQQVPSDLDVLVLHQAYQPLLPFEGVWEVGDEDIIAKNPKVVLIGHVHTPKIFKLPNGTQVVSPGATVLHTFDAPYVRTVPGISEYNGGITYATLENGVVSLETLQARKYVRVDADLVDEQTLDLALANAKALDYPSFFLVDFAVKAGVYQALQERFAGVPTSLRPKGLSTVSLIGERATAGTQRAPIEEVIARHVDRDGYPELFAVCLDIANLESKDPEALRNLIEEHLAKISCD